MKRMDDWEWDCTVFSFSAYERGNIPKVSRYCKSTLKIGVGGRGPQEENLCQISGVIWHTVCWFQAGCWLGWEWDGRAAAILCLHAKKQHEHPI